MNIILTIIIVNLVCVLLLVLFVHINAALAFAIAIIGGIAGMIGLYMFCELRLEEEGPE